jgi:hypothetical protein
MLVYFQVLGAGMQVLLMCDEMIFVVHIFVKLCEGASLDLADSLSGESELFGDLF